MFRLKKFKINDEHKIHCKLQYVLVLIKPFQGATDSSKNQKFIDAKQEK
jgi:hypothetical protein